MNRKIPITLGACAVTLAAAASAFAQMPLMPDAKTMTPSYVQTDLDTLHGGGKVLHDKLLANPWGIAFAPGTFIWISDNDTGVSTLYDATGAIAPLVVTIPPGMGQTPPSNPTGVIVNPVNNFDSSSPEFDGALFIFASENGTVDAWEATAKDMPTSATLVVDNSMNGAVYKGLAIANDGGQDQLYVTNFNAGTVEVYDDTFTLVPSTSSQLVANAFTDPAATAGFAPFGIFNIGGTLFVTYAKQNAAKNDEINAPGNGFIDEYEPNGQLVKRFATGNQLDSPWGIVTAPAMGFGPLSGKLLVGNFGDGRINAFDPTTGDFVATMTDAHGHDIVNPGLWGLEFGTGVTNSAGPDTGATNELFFTAGGAKQNQGTFGNIQFTTTTSKKTGSGMPAPGPYGVMPGMM
jgi:uncharacterized protein (TIGR03118 family)